MRLGCIGDDFTGSSDLGNTLTKAGMRVVQYSGVPEGAAGDEDAAVIALKSRTIPAEEAVAQSLAACDWLLGQGAEQLLFKYCSTFDSTDAGNIGPVAQALAERLGEDRVVVCPAFPGAGRTVYQGHLFVNDQLLSRSGMEDHPLTPMREPDLRRVLAPQTDWDVAHIGAEVVWQGAEAIRAALGGPRAMVLVDAVRDGDLVAIGRAAAGRKLVTGGSGIALGLPANFGISPGDAAKWHGEAGPCVILSGSCSRATRGQVARHLEAHEGREATAEAVLGGLKAAELADWATGRDCPLIYSSADPATVAAAQAAHGREKVAGAIEGLFAELAGLLAERGVTRIISAGGETSGAVVAGLGAEALEIGPEIAPGVPALRVRGRPLVLALKSGNFGQEDFFARAAGVLDAR
ncbi:3-oxo-tetronate kinase [Pontivivens ytuae]|uniref:3-oxo-tetronate kinase n=1 Tax=Pontivivens ytuae TaxID=2789856 RepID=A0A7S9LRI2_9RHOB|nr:3-oxo-tetronate kinase [Pontivivens ytuae]QPH53415.1 four-carbon acid sugar kinase family protein [Pontivivens ytuae]